MKPSKASNNLVGHTKEITQIKWNTDKLLARFAFNLILSSCSTSAEVHVKRITDRTFAFKKIFGLENVYDSEQKCL